MTHELKTIHPYFGDVVLGNKRFDLRKFDRDYQVGDCLLLKEWEVIGHYYTGREVKVSIVYILTDAEDFGLMPGYCILGLDDIKESQVKD